jgi:hypothetical protein
MRIPYFRSLAAAVGIAVVAGVLGLIAGVEAAPQGGQPPFRNAVEQREDMIRELQEIKHLLKEQNALLRTLAKDPGHAPTKH